MPYRRHSETTLLDEDSTPLIQQQAKLQKRKSWDPRSPRIPKSLQNVFLTAARGEEVTEAPVKDKLFKKKLGKKKKEKKKKAYSDDIPKAISMPQLILDSDSDSTRKEEELTPHQVKEKRERERERESRRNCDLHSVLTLIVLILLFSATRSTKIFRQNTFQARIFDAKVSKSSVRLSL